MQRALGSVSHLLKSQAYVNGEWIKSSKSYDVINPSTLEKIGSVPDMNQSDIRDAIACARTAQLGWRLKSGNERGQLLRRWLDTVMEHRNALGTLITLESGKVLKEGLGEVDYGASYLEWYSEAARRIYGEIIPTQSGMTQSLLYREPIGACAFITSWNFPVLLPLRKTAAALAAGCTVVLKPSEETPLSALALAELGDRAGIPRGVFNVVTSDKSSTPAVGEEMCTNPDIQGLSFTGSCVVGKKLYKLCSSTVKKVTLELGGNAPFIIFPSADIEVVMRAINTTKFRNNGQTCISANRVLVHTSRIEEVLERCVDLIKGKRVADGLEEGAELGPLINQSAVDKVTRHITDGVEKGGEVLVGGDKIGNGHFYQPTLLSGLTEDMDIWNEETFGPVIPVRAFDTEEEAIHLANNVKEGLAAYVMTTDYRQIHRVTPQLQYGLIGVNEGMISSVWTPFGGVKESGIGREGGLQGINEYLLYKFVSMGGLQ
ncbi:NAD-dependent succinate-semialdehyde dehydrogenase [Oopsacas minuta]|uniref:NAD-dependent succinate-semialdehyde dehydrogenase n=1 Tax=Oopsacas minuta TaxID=111878 RepID=A0AAV7KIL6_9METZ|nr:NAD-dependent succinate-semialdehyde dehydrogenase [Oopsacas minuta]